MPKKNSASTLLQEGIHALTSGDLKTAQHCLSRCPECKIDPEVSYRLGVAQSLSGAPTAAIFTWKQTLKLDASFAPALYDLALAYVACDDNKNAAITFTRLLTFHPDHPEGRFNFGNLLYRMGHTEEAISMYAPLTDSPNPPRGILVNLGRALRRAGRLEEADACYHRAILDNPDDHFTQWNRSHVLCLLERWEEGFAAWEHRLGTTVKLPITPNLPEWLGCDLAPPQTLLLVSEQGHGDAIQCLRYIPYLYERGCKPKFALHASLVPLFKSLLPEAECVDFSQGESLAADAWCPLFSLPHRLKLPKPKDTLPPSRNSMFKAGIKNIFTNQPNLGTGIHVGLTWAGNPGHDNDHLRSTTLATMQPIIEARPDIHWHSLQFGAARQEILDLPRHLQPTELPPVDNFKDTAQYISAMNLVICVDTAVAHLAGTLGIPTWVLLAAEPDWRWGIKKPDTAWYPNMHLFRQSNLGDWPPVINQISRAIHDTYPCDMGDITK